MQLAPRQPYQQSTHLLLMQGSLSRRSGAAGGGSLRCGSPGKPAPLDMYAPAVLPWLAGHMQQGPAGAGAAGTLPVSPQAAAAAAAAPPLIAGSGGALLLACPEPGEPPPSTPGSDSASDTGSPFVPSLTSAALRQRQQPAAQGEEAAEPEGGLDSGGMWAPELERPPGEALERREGRGQQLPPAGRPMHRVRSRRLPLSSAWPTLEADP